MSEPARSTDVASDDLIALAKLLAWADRDEHDQARDPDHLWPHLADKSQRRYCGLAAVALARISRAPIDAVAYVDEVGELQVTDNGTAFKALFDAMDTPPVGRKLLALYANGSTLTTHPSPEVAGGRNHAAHEAFWLSMRTKGKKGNVKRAIDAALSAHPLPQGEAGPADTFDARENLHRVLDECTIPTEPELSMAREAIERLGEADDTDEPVAYIDASDLEFLKTGKILYSDVWHGEAECRRDTDVALVPLSALTRLRAKLTKQGDIAEFYHGQSAAAESSLAAEKQLREQAEEAIATQNGVIVSFGQRAVELTAEHHRRGVKIIEMTEQIGAQMCRADKAEAALAAAETQMRAKDEALEPFIAVAAIIAPSYADDDFPLVTTKDGPGVFVRDYRRIAALAPVTTPPAETGG